MWGLCSIKWADITFLWSEEISLSLKVASSSLRKIAGHSGNANWKSRQVTLLRKAAFSLGGEVIVFLQFCQELSKSCLGSGIVIPLVEIDWGWVSYLQLGSPFLELIININKLFQIYKNHEGSRKRLSFRSRPLESIHLRSQQFYWLLYFASLV